MIEPLPDPPAGVTAFRLGDKLTEDEYADVLVPALRVATEKGEVRLLLIGERGFDLLSLKSRFEDARDDDSIDFANSKEWRRLAIVADANFVLRATFPAVAKAIPVDTKFFGLKDEAEARTWVTG